MKKRAISKLVLKLYFLNIFLNQSGFIFAQSAPLNVYNSRADSLQTVIVDTARFDMNKDLAEQLISFEEICAIAFRNSPLISYEDAQIEGRLENLRYTRYIILDNIYPFANASDGTQSLFITGTLPADNIQLLRGFRYGINLQVPLSSLFGRRHQLKEARTQYTMAMAKRQIAQLELKKDLIQAYHNLLTSQRVLKARIKDEQIGYMALQVAEIELRQGKIEPEMLARISSVYTSSKSLAEEERGEFMKNFYTLEVMVGVPLQSLKSK